MLFETKYTLASVCGGQYRLSCQIGSINHGKNNGLEHTCDMTNPSSGVTLSALHRIKELNVDSGALNWNPQIRILI